MDSLRDMALFVEVANAKSFTRAAATLGIPVSSLSRRIAELESSVGLPLFNRSTRRVDLTEAGARYFSRCQSIVAAAREAGDELRGMAESPQGLLRISADAEMGPLLLAPAVAEFLDLYPEVTFDLDLSPRRVDLIAEGVDIAIRFGNLVDSTLKVRTLCAAPAHLYASPAYVARHGMPMHANELAGRTRLHLLHAGDDGSWRLSCNGEQVHVPASSAVRANNMSMIRHIARAGAGIAVIDELMASRDVESGALLRVLTAWTMPAGVISLLTPNRLLPAKTRRFIDLLTARVASMMGQVIGPGP